MRTFLCLSFLLVASAGWAVACSNGGGPADADAAAVDTTIPDASDVGPPPGIDAGYADINVDTPVDCNALPGDAAPASFSEVQGFFQRRCAAGTTCHTVGDALPGLVLDSAFTFDELVNHPSTEVPTIFRVDPGHPERSYIWLKLLGTFAQLQACTAPGNDCGTQMPQMSPISEGFQLSEAAVLYNWICEGASQD